MKAVITKVEFLKLLICELMGCHTKRFLNTHLKTTLRFCRKKRKYSLAELLIFVTRDRVCFNTYYKCHF